MTWFRVDDAFPTHPKVLSIPRRDRPSAIGLWLLAGTWCAQQHTDGHLSRDMISEFGGTPKLASVLVQAKGPRSEHGLWEITDTGFYFHDWEDYQPTRAEIEAERSAARERMRKARLRRSSPEQQANERRSSGAVTVTRPYPSLPGPSTPEQKTPRAPRSDVSPDDPAFAAFWSAYPRKTDRGHALKAWPKAVKSADPADIARAAKAFAEANRDTDPKFIPHPATWLNGQRWADEAPSAPERQTFVEGW